MLIYYVRLLVNLNPVDLKTLPERYPKNPLLFYLDYHKKRILKESFQSVIAGTLKLKSMKKHSHGSSLLIENSSNSNSHSSLANNSSKMAVIQLERIRSLIQSFNYFGQVFGIAYQFTPEYQKSVSATKQALFGYKVDPATNISLAVLLYILSFLGRYFRRRLF